MLTRLIELREIIESNQWSFKSDAFWRGADLVVTDHPIEPDPVFIWNDDHVVVTKYAEEASALLFAIKSSCIDWYDSMSKYELFGRVGDALEKAAEEGKSLNEILLDMVDEAIKVEKEFTWKPYFAYGSNMDEEQMKHRCPSAELIGKVVLNDYQFALDSEGVATIVPSRYSKVEGLLWRINKDDENSLDRYEGVVAGCYRKETIQVVFKDYMYNTLVYISNRNNNNGKRRNGYLKRIIQAAENKCFSNEYIKELRKYTKDNIENNI
ncbi:MAG: gamma-glutamylcyclotransferase [Oceanobacillus sp.]|nr:gamma-glutamylcyclotransferase [Oceanobacillus sp.]